MIREPPASSAWDGRRLISALDTGRAWTTVTNPGAPAAISERRIYGPLDSLATWYTGNGDTAASIGYARIAPGTPTPDGLAIFGDRVNDILVSEASVPASPAVSRGRIFADINPPTNTGIAIANPNTQTVTISFYFTDSNGRDFGQGLFSMAPGNQMAVFLTEEPFRAPTPLTGTMTFTATAPVAAIALRGFTNERSEFLMTTLPLVDPAAAPQFESAIVPHFAAGGGWRTQVVLVNPGGTTLDGVLQFWSQGSPGTAAQPATVIADGQARTSVSYSIPAKSSRRIQVSGDDAVTAVGSARIVPKTGEGVPVGLLVFSFSRQGVTVSEGGVPGVRPASAATMSAYVYNPGGGTGPIDTGIAIANPAATEVTALVTLKTADGSPFGSPAALRIPANGQVALFLSQIPGFEYLRPPSMLQGTISVSTTAPSGLAVVAVRGRQNERGDLLISVIPPFPNTRTTSEQFLPHIVDGGGYSTQLTLRSIVAQASSVRFFAQSGANMQLRLR
jgi:hypothetical protein